MTKKKKTMYEMLEVSPTASDSEIQAAYQLMSKNLQSARNDKNGEDIDLQLKVIGVAFNTLSVKRTRDAYDARLGGNALNNEATSLGMVPIVPKEASSLKTEAMLLKSEAMSLKAEAVSLKADAIALKVDSAYRSSAESVLDKVSRWLSPVKKAFAIVATLIGIGIVVQLMFMIFVNRQAATVVAADSKANEKVMLEDYYQRTGVRVATKEEMDSLEADNRREEQRQRLLQEQERVKQKQDYQYQQFVQESRREGDMVSQNLRIAEENARREEERKTQQAEEAKRMKEEQEAQQIEQQKESWRRTLTERTTSE